MLEKVKFSFLKNAPGKAAFKGKFWFLFCFYFPLLGVHEEDLNRFLDFHVVA